MPRPPVSPPSHVACGGGGCRQATWDAPAAHPSRRACMRGGGRGAQLPKPKGRGGGGWRSTHPPSVDGGTPPSDPEGTARPPHQKQPADGGGGFGPAGHCAGAAARPPRRAATSMVRGGCALPHRPLCNAACWAGPPIAAACAGVVTVRAHGGCVLGGGRRCGGDARRRGLPHLPRRQRLGVTRRTPRLPAGRDAGSTGGGGTSGGGSPPGGCACGRPQPRCRRVPRHPWPGGAPRGAAVVGGRESGGGDPPALPERAVEPAVGGGRASLHRLPRSTPRRRAAAVGGEGPGGGCPIRSTWGGRLGGHSVNPCHAMTGAVVVWSRRAQRESTPLLAGGAVAVQISRSPMGLRVVPRRTGNSRRRVCCLVGPGSEGDFVGLTVPVAPDEPWQTRPSVGPSNRSPRGAAGAVGQSGTGTDSGSGRVAEAWSREVTGEA